MTDAVFDTDAGSLVFRHPVDDADLDETYLQAAAVAVASSAELPLRVRNDSEHYIAAGVEVAAGAPEPAAGLTDGSAQVLLSTDGAVYAPSVSLGDLAPQQVSGLLWLRRVTPPETPEGGYGFQLTATATAWLPATDAPSDPGPDAGVADTIAGSAPVEDEQAQLGGHP